MRQPLFAFVVAVSCAWLAFSCQDKEVLRSLCSSDQSCIEKHDGNPHWACDPTVGDCVCTDDAACLEKEHCEKRPGGDGRCHPNRTCDWNSDCPQGQFCDTETHFCRKEGCVVDRQCQLGHVCNQGTGQCVPGCRTSGDCSVPGDACLCMGTNGEKVPCACLGETEEDRLKCQMGACTSDTCEDDSFCKWKQFCKAPLPGETLPRCVDAGEPYCDDCRIQPGSTNYRCGETGANYCLQDTTTSSGSFCGADCYEGQECPNGFTCRDVRVVMQTNACASDADCKPNAQSKSCEEDEDCRNGEQCVSGRCASKCGSAEAGVRGYCGCVVDADCATQDCVAGECEITGRRCATNEDCRTGIDRIVCQHDGNFGFCWIGKNCAPDEGISCAAVRAGKGPLD
ncbi:MAG TPA: hypothetical protein VGD74_05625 [Vulgatibacter sp.]